MSKKLTIDEVIEELKKSKDKLEKYNAYSGDSVNSSAPVGKAEKKVVKREKLMCSENGQWKLTS